MLADERFQLEYCPIPAKLGELGIVHKVGGHDADDGRRSSRCGNGYNWTLAGILVGTASE